MNRIQFLKRLLATAFGAAVIKQTKATVIPTEGTSPELVEREESKRYLLSATVAGTPYYDFPTVGKQLLTLNEPEDDLYPDPNADYSPSEAQRTDDYALYAPRLRHFDEYPAILKLEPDNEFDFRAIEVYWKNHKMGYIPRTYNKVLHNLMKDGAELKAAIRLAIPTEREESIMQYQEESIIPTHDFQCLYDLRIRVYLVSDNDGSLLG